MGGKEGRREGGGREGGSREGGREREGRGERGRNIGRESNKSIFSLSYMALLTGQMVRDQLL